MPAGNWRKGRRSQRAKSGLEKYQMQPKSEMACACLWLYTEVSRCCVIMKGSDQT